MGDEYLTIDQVAELLKVSGKTIRRLVRRGEIPGFKVGGQWRIKRGDIDEWVAEQKRTAHGNGGR
jgi:excisionase family DNA binding protein